MGASVPHGSQPRHFLKDSDISTAEQAEILALAAQMKAHRHEFQTLKDKSVALVFAKASTRTRVSFQVGVTELGGNPLVIDTANTHHVRGETLADTGAVLSRYVDAIVLRTGADSDIEELASVSSAPVINALTDNWHPCQLLADLQTMIENGHNPAQSSIAFLGDTSHNMGRSYVAIAAMTGCELRLASPKAYQPDANLISSARAAGAKILLTEDPVEAVTGADVVTTDTWTSMTQSDGSQRRADLGRYQLNTELLHNADNEAIVLHCLPAHRGEEITSAVLDGPASRVLDQAENRLHAQKALLTWLIGDRP
ncbi:ornithine carbamoyltransferase [Natronoglycomyces albus]|uniref:Ornithine carbamoyltransferase n=1 Tax=Natronoglycomyces albus TaxID=2811108 RepID=A0A895XUS6_9ACTN|nr:ornithine carbamoyltransferase [Natronoglycomyces albus]